MVHVRSTWGERIEWLRDNHEDKRDKNDPDYDLSLFCMSLDDFRDAFSSVSFCGFEDDGFACSDMKVGAWAGHVASGVGSSDNPQYMFSLKSGAISVRLSIRQQDRQALPNLPLNLTLCKLPAGTTYCQHDGDGDGTGDGDGSHLNSYAGATLPLRTIPEKSIIASTGNSTSSTVQFELNLLKSKTGEAITYVLVPAFGKFIEVTLLRLVMEVEMEMEMVMEMALGLKCLIFSNVSQVNCSMEPTPCSL